MFCVELDFDLLHFFFTINLNIIIKDELGHFHGRDETMKVFERHVDELLVLS